MRRMLHGLDAISIHIGQLHPDIEGSGLSRLALQEELATNLRQVGVRIMAEEGRMLASDRPELNLNVNVTPIENFPMYSVFISMQLRQSACLTRNLILCEPVVTWEEASDIRTVSVSQLTDVKQDVHAIIGRFVNAYLAENPKQ